MWNYNKIDSKLQYNGFRIPIKPIWCSKIVCGTTTKLVQNFYVSDPELRKMDPEFL